MKKILVTAAASMLATTMSFSFEEYYSYVNELKNSINGREDLYIGSVVDLNTNAVVGFAGCDETGYFINLNVINSYNSYKKDVITLRHGFEAKDKLCDVMKTASSITAAPSITGEDGKTYEFGTEGYNGSKNCVAQYLDVTNATLGVTIPVTNMVCYGVKPLDPLAEKPELDKYTGGKPSEYFNANYDKILAWNDKNSDSTNALFLDKESNLRGSYTTKEILDVALKSGTVGAGVDQDGVLLFTFGINNDKPAIYIGDKTIELTSEMLDKAPALKEAYNAYKEKGDVKYVMGCEDSITIAEGAEGVPTGYIYGMINGKKFIKYPVINRASKAISPYVCDSKMGGKEFTKDQYELLRNAGLLLSKPVVIDENKQKEIDDDKPAAKPSTPKYNSPKGKVIELLKSADMPGLKIDEKGRFLGEVLTYGKGKAVLTLPNDEEIEINIPIDSELNKLGADAKASASDLGNTVYAYGCDIPLVEKVDKNTPEIGVIYVIYNGHAVRSIPAFVKGSFKCNKQMANREISQADYFNFYSLAMDKMKKHPAFK